MNDHKNMILAIVLSALVLLGWQYFVGMPQMERQREQAQQQQAQQRTPPATPDGRPQPQATPTPGVPPQAPSAPGTPAAGQPLTREAALAASPRVPVETPRLAGSINLRGGRIDDLALKDYRVTVDPNSPPVILLSPSGSPTPFYAEAGWVPGGQAGVAVPGPDTLWQREGDTGPLTVGKPVTLTWNNDQGLTFRRTITVDDRYLFTVKDEVVNNGSAPVTLHPYALVSRHGTPPTLGYYILHEGLVGVLNDKLEEVAYSDIEKRKLINFDTTNAWLGITDKYWAATLLPETDKHLKARFTSGMLGTQRTFQADYLLDAQTIQPGATGVANARLFAGAKEVSIVDGYEKELNLNRFELLIDWGWFYFVTKPMFFVIDWLFRLVGNFGVAILLVTVLIKLIFFPLANKSYASMAKMKMVQPQLMAIRDRYADDKMKQQQAMMELYKKEKINPLSGCLPILIQIPVFFALYKVLFVSIEMRHAPFFGWIKDLSAPDPTTIFNLFGLLPWDPSIVPVIGPFLMLGVWPIIMGITMWVQMKMNPTPPDPTQKMLFDWMPIIFTFMLAGFASGLVIYWAWNNFLSVLQQGVIMRRHGAKIELFDNIRAMLPSASKNKAGG